MSLVLTLAVGSPHRARAQTTACTAATPEVVSVSFRGNDKIPTATLEETIETAPSSGIRRLSHLFGTRRCLAQGALLRDLARLMLFYRRKGYPRVAVDTAVEKATLGVKVRFTIRENAPTVLDSIDVRGVADSGVRARLHGAVKLRPGDPLDRYSLDASSAAMVAGLRRAGYLTATVTRGERVDAGARRGMTWFDVAMGPRVRLGEVHVETRGLDSGQSRIPVGRVERLTRLKSGEVLGTQQLSDARRGLDAVGLYDEVRVSLDSIRSTPTGDATADVNVAVVEGAANEVHFKGGYGTLDCVRLQLQASRLGVLGRPNRFEVTTSISKVGVGAPFDFAPGMCSSETQADPYSQKLNYYAGATYTVSPLGRRGWSRSVSLYTERRGEYLAYLKTTYLGASASVSHGFSRYWTGTVAYDLSYGRTEAEPAVLCATFSACTSADRNQFTEALPFGLVSSVASFDNTDTPTDPTHGESARGELRIAPRWLGTAVRQQVIGARLSAAKYFRLSDHVVFAARLQGAIVNTLGGADFIPQGERLFAGGATSVRGFQQNEVGARVYLVDSVRTKIQGDTLLWALPPDSTGWRAVPTGGTAAAVGNIELRVRPKMFTSLVQFVVFVDAGNVWTRDETQLASSPIFVTPGVGLRISTPVGPIRFDIAANPYAPPAGPAYRDVSLGYQTAPLYCVSVGNELPVTGFGQTDAAGKPIPPVQAEGPCPSTFSPERPSGFFNRLTLHFSIGQAF